MFLSTQRLQFFCFLQVLFCEFILSKIVVYFSSIFVCYYSISV